MKYRDLITLEQVNDIIQLRQVDLCVQAEQFVSRHAISERKPETVPLKDQQLLMYYHNANLRQLEKPRQEQLL
jgi:hypothetical protein